MLDERFLVDNETGGKGVDDLVGMLSDVAIAMLFGLLVAVLQAGGDGADQEDLVARAGQKEHLVAYFVHHHAVPYDRSIAPYNQWEALLARPPEPKAK